MILEIKFEIGDKLGPPLIKIMIDDYLVLYEGPAVSEFYREFDISRGEHELKIVHYGKTDNDHLYHSDGTIAVDKYVMIQSIKIDDIYLTDSELQHGEFWPVYSLDYVNTMISQGKDLPGSITPNLYLGHNGTWKWCFIQPFVDWIIQQRKPGPKLDNTIFRTSADILAEAKEFFNQVKEI